MILPISIIILGSRPANGIEKTGENLKLSSSNRQLFLSILGIKKCLDSTTTPMDKVRFCSRPCCLLMGLTSQYITENVTPYSKLHYLATACCTLSINLYAASLLYNGKKD
jgi:hypothetical protein